MDKPFVTAPIVGATKNHLEDAIAAISVRLTREEIASLEGAYAPHAVVGFFLTQKGGHCITRTDPAAQRGHF